MNKVSSLLGLSCIDTLFAIKKKHEIYYHDENTPFKEV